MGGWWAPCFTEPAHRLNFEVGGEPVTFQDANLRNRRQAELSRFQNYYKSDLCSTLLQLLSERNSFKPGQGDSQAFGKSGKEDLVQVASYLTLDVDQLNTSTTFGHYNASTHFSQGGVNYYSTGKPVFDTNPYL